MPRTVTVLFIALTVLAFEAAAVPSKQRIGQLMDSSNYEILANELRLAAERDPAEFAKTGYGYLLGRIEEKRGNYAAAAKLYHSVALSDPDLKPYALKHLSQIMRLGGNLAFERLFLDEIAYREGASVLEDSARLRLIRNYFESGDYLSVIEALTNGLAGARSMESDADSRELLLLLGKSYHRGGMPKSARAVFEEIIASVPVANQPDDHSLEAAKGLDMLDGGDSEPGVAVENLSVAEHMRRAGIYQFNRNFSFARLHYISVVENYRESSETPAAVYQIARGYDQEREYHKSLYWYREILSSYPDNELEASALYGTAGAFANLDDTENAVAAYQEYIVKNPDAKNLERAHLNIIDAYRDAGQKAKALEWSSKIQNLFRGKMGEAVALFCDARIHITEGKWEKALIALSRLRGLKDLGGRIAGGTNRTEVNFLTAFVLEKLNRVPEAIDIYLGIHDGRGEYYGWRATERLRELSAAPANKGIFRSRIDGLERGRMKLKPDELRIAEQEIFRLKKDPSRKALTSAYQRLKDYALVPDPSHSLPTSSKVAKKLLDLSLFDEAAPEIEISLRSRFRIEGGDLSDFDDKTAAALAVYYVKGGFADRAIRFIEPKWKKIPDDFQIELIPRSHASLLYPVPFRYELLKYGKQENVDPRFILAVMRQESRFQADVKSVAAARGLMQFISGTARKMADELKLEPYSDDQLYDPETSIRFGSRYIANLYKEFPGQSEAVAASYNAGEDRMARWLGRSGSKDPDEYVAEIVFRQTKDYVYSVMANYRMYRFLYDERLVPTVKIRER